MTAAEAKQPIPARQTAAVAYYAAGVGALSIMDALVKGTTARYSVYEVSFLRYVFGTLVIALIVLWLRPGWPSRQLLFVNGVRSLITSALSLTFFFSLTALPLAEAVALSFLSPAFLALFGAWLLKEKLSANIGVALGVGFVGTLIITFGQATYGTYGPLAIYGAMAAFASAVLYALSMVLLRSRASVDPIPLIVLTLNACAMVTLAIPMPFVWVQPTLPDLGIFLGVGVLATAGHLFLAKAFSQAEAAGLAALEYTALLWAAGLGFAFFSETPGLATIIGSLFIVASALLSNRR